MTDLTQLISEVADVFGDPDAAHDVGPSFSCLEANAIARLLAAAGHGEQAVTWLLGHASEDRYGDEHRIHEGGDDSDGRGMNEDEVREYVREWGRE